MRRLPRPELVDRMKLSIIAEKCSDVNLAINKITPQRKEEDEN